MTACYLSPIGNSPQTSTSGTPLSGGLIYTYQAGTSTPQATYMDNSGAVGQANPIVLNTYGLPSNPIWIPGGQAVKFVIKDALGNTTRTIDTVQGINDPASNSAPAFSAYQSAAQSIASAVATKVQLQSKEFDTANRFDASTNYRFQPNVPGYYQIQGAVGFATPGAIVLASIYKNGAELKRGTQFGTVASEGYASAVSALVPLNGTTDYVELFAGQSSGSAQNTINTQASTYLQGFMVRTL